MPECRANVAHVSSTTSEDLAAAVGGLDFRLHVARTVQELWADEARTHVSYDCFAITRVRACRDAGSSQCVDQPLGLKAVRQLGRVKRGIRARRR